MKNDREKIISFLKHYGFLIPSAEIYQGLANSWDLGPYGTELKRNLKNVWWKFFINNNPYNVGIDGSIITHNQVLEASGHTKNFSDWLLECNECHKRYRMDQFLGKEIFESFLANREKEKFICKKKCSNCKSINFAGPRRFNLLFNINLSSTGNKENTAYLRPETCQSIFTNFLSVQRTTHRKLPFGIGQIGKSFRNEVTLNHGIFRTNEFEQMELEFFCDSEKSEEWWKYWVNKSWTFLEKLISNKELVKKINLEDEELPHYARKTVDWYFNYHFGWGELCSNSHRGDYDLKQHSLHSQKELSFQRIIPEVIEISYGVERLMLAILEDSYQEEQLSKEKRSVLKINPILSPFFLVVIPLSKKLSENAYQLYLNLIKKAQFNVGYEDTGNIGKNYRRQDAIGTYYCLTFDFQSLDDKKVTIRNRNSMVQVRVKVDELTNYLNSEYTKQWDLFLDE
jgi:glycyl-tRNA synthetase